MTHFCNHVIGPEGQQCGLRIDKPGKCKAHDADAGHEAHAEAIEAPAELLPANDDHKPKKSK